MQQDRADWHRSLHELALVVAAVGIARPLTTAWAAAAAASVGSKWSPCCSMAVALGALGCLPKLSWDHDETQRSKAEERKSEKRD